MSHTTKYQPELDTKDPYDAEVTFIHNGDFSGGVEIVITDKVLLEKVEGRGIVWTPASPDATPEFRVTVPFRALRMLVLEKLRRQMISDLENTTDDDLWELMTF